MNGPEHYREAERLIRTAEQHWDESEAEHNACLQNALVHATLAEVAAIIDSRGYGAFEIRNNEAWEQVLGRPINGDCTDTSDCPSTVHIDECPARRTR